MILFIPHDENGVGSHAAISLTAAFSGSTSVLGTSRMLRLLFSADLAAPLLPTLLLFENSQEAPGNERWTGTWNLVHRKANAKQRSRSLVA